MLPLPAAFTKLPHGCGGRSPMSLVVVCRIDVELAIWIEALDCIAESIPGSRRGYPQTLAHLLAIFPRLGKTPQRAGHTARKDFCPPPDQGQVLEDIEGNPVQPQIQVASNAHICPRTRGERQSDVRCEAATARQTVDVLIKVEKMVTNRTDP